MQRLVTFVAACMSTAMCLAWLQQVEMPCPGLRSQIPSRLTVRTQFLILLLLFFSLTPHLLRKILPLCFLPPKEATMKPAWPAPEVGISCICKVINSLNHLAFEFF